MQKHHNGHCDGQNLVRAPFPQTHGFSAKDEGHKLPSELNKSASGSQCGEVSMSAQGAESVRSGEKGYLSGKRPQKMEPSDRPDLCHHLFSIESGLEAEHTRFLASARRASATMDGALFSKAQIIESFSKNMETQMWEKAAGHPLSTGMEKDNNRFCQEGQVTTDQRRKFLGCAGAGFSCLWSHPRTSPACGWIYSQPIFLCSL